MSSFNKVIIMGNLTRTPELRSTPGGQQVADITLACNETWNDAGGNKQERVTFVDITLWGKQAENVCRWKKQGEALLVEGKLQQDKWVDKESGKNRSKLKVQALSVTFVGGGKSESAPRQQRGEPKNLPDDGAGQYSTSLPDDGGTPF